MGEEVQDDDSLAGRGAACRRGLRIAARDAERLPLPGAASVTVGCWPATGTVAPFFDARSVAVIGASADPLKIGGRPVASFRYESSVELMRYRLVGWDDASALVPRRAAAYLTAMQRCAVAEDALAHPDLFPVRTPARDRTV